MLPVAMSLSRLFSQSYVLFQELLRIELRNRGLSDRVQPGTGPVLFALHEDDDRTISEVGDGLGLARSTMTSIVARLERNQLVSSRRDPDDGRAKRIVLTARGRATLKKLLTLAVEMDDLLGGEWSSKKRAEIEAGLEDMRVRMLESLESHSHSR